MMFYKILPLVALLACGPTASNNTINLKHVSVSKTFPFSFHDLENDIEVYADEKSIEELVDKLASFTDKRIQELTPNYVVLFQAGKNPLQISISLKNNECWYRLNEEKVTYKSSVKDVTDIFQKILKSKPRPPKVRYDKTIKTPAPPTQ